MIPDDAVNASEAAKQKVDALPKETYETATCDDSAKPNDGDAEPSDTEGEKPANAQAGTAEGLESENMLQ